MDLPRFILNMILNYSEYCWLVRENRVVGLKTSVLTIDQVFVIV